MKFPQYNKLLVELQICSVLLWAVFMAMGSIALAYNQASIAFFLFAMVLLLFLAFFTEIQKEKKRVILMDESGISLTVNAKQEWAFRWEEIEKLRYSSLYRLEGIRFVPKAAPEQTLWKPTDGPRTHYDPSCNPTYAFHLNKTAKEALARYCPIPIEKS